MSKAAVFVRLNEKEAETLAKMAEKEGVGRPEVVRRLILREVKE